MSKSRKKSNHVGATELNLTLFEPKSDWSYPQRFPDLSGERILGFDCETRDPELDKRGPGFFRGSAEVVGVSLATTDRAWYFPMGHLGGGNMDRESVCRYLQDLFSRSDLTLVGANTRYDLEGCDHFGLRIACRLLDVQIAEALIDEELPTYALDAISRRYLGVGKDESLLNDAAAAFGTDPKRELWKLPAKFVGPYAEADAHNTLRIFHKQLEILEDEELLPIFQLESELLPIIYKMRKLGILIDLDAARRESDALHSEERTIADELRSGFGLTDPWSGKDIARICGIHGINHPKTDKGNPSFTAAFLTGSSIPLFKRLRELRELNRLRKVFIDDWIFGNHIDGIIHPEWHQMRRDEGGTRTGRMAASNPNPQQVPSRSRLANRIRRLFIPLPGKKWAKVDYSQQEPRILVHYASLLGFKSAENIRQAYTNDRETDIYQFLAESCGLSRRDAKDATLGRCYGMGVARFAERNKLDKDEAKHKLESFDKKVPFVRETANKVASLADKRGWIRTLCGRKRHFPLWEPVDCFEMKQEKQDVVPVRHALAEEKWPGRELRRAFVHKALNSLIQGSAADMTKAAMIAVHEKLGLIPHMQVHDELNYSVENEEQAREIQRVCETCVEMELPIKADLDLGEHWK
jgi:DNA polymerase I-like protein with 3'-5' exonuclease and polymerase domains